MNYNHEFGTVDLLLNSEFETRGVDAFSISLLKAERQIRRIFTFLIYQNESFNGHDIHELRKALSENKRMYFENFVIGINSIYSKSLEDIYGMDYKADFELLKEYSKDRNKIFHGQLTNKFLSRQDFEERIFFIKKWCQTIALEFSKEIGFDGFERNSFKKSKKNIALINTNNYSTIIDYKNLLKTLSR